MFLAFWDFIQIPFGWILAQLYAFTQSYGVALILFAILIKVILLPMSAKSKKSMMKMSRLAPKVQALQKKYENDQQKQSLAVQQLYKEEGVSMGGGCLWSLLPLLLLFPLYAVVRQPITYMLQESADVAKKIIEVIRGAVPEAFSESGFYDQMVAAPLIPSFAQQLKEVLPELSERTLEGINFNFLGIDLGEVPAWKFWAWEITEEKGLWQYIGGALIPVLSALSQVLTTVISQRVNKSLITNDKGLKDKEAADNDRTNKQSKTMMFIFPIMSLWIGFTVPGALSLYWFIQGVTSMLVDMVLTKRYRKIYDAEDAAKLAKHLKEEAEEAEKERIRAQRREANPEGITANTSKKKLQQQQQREKEAAKAEAAREYAAKKGLDTEEKKEEAAPKAGDRPFSRGRAYDPNRYATKDTEE